MANKTKKGNRPAQARRRKQPAKRASAPKPRASQDRQTPGPSAQAAPDPPAVRARIWPAAALLFSAYFLLEGFAALLLKPESPLGLGFGALWALLLTGLCLLLPRLAGQIAFGLTYCVCLCWTLAQTGYFQVFGKLMWLSDMRYVSEGSHYFDTVLASFPVLWWVGAGVFLALGVLGVLWMPKGRRSLRLRLGWGLVSAAAVAGLFVMPQAVYLQDQGVWGTRSDYMQVISYRASYQTMYDAKKTYNACGIYQLTFRDLWKHVVYPLTPGYRQAVEEQVEQIDQYFTDRGPGQDNEMTGIFEGKNVILVLMESMDDWAVNPQDTPTLCRLMDEGINFTNFYTPGYGSVRTFNTEFCVNTGIYLPTTGDYAFNYVTNDYGESLAGLLTEAGYDAQTFHYNEANFYSRGVFEPAMGYSAYNSYMDYTQDEDELYDDCFLFNDPDLRDLFFRDGPTLNFIITRSAHLSYVYREVLSNWALQKYPEYQGISGDEEVDCMRVKAKLVDDLFARLLLELEVRDQLDNTVIVAFTDHYAYGFEDVDLMMELSGVEDPLLLEKTPCFIWSPDGPSLQVDKTLHTADLLPTVLNLMGLDSPYAYLGQDAFDQRYQGYALFPDGSWVSDGVAARPDGAGSASIVANAKGKELTQEEIQAMVSKAVEFAKISNLILQTDYYRVKGDS